MSAIVPPVIGWCIVGPVVHVLVLLAHSAI